MTELYRPLFLNEPPMLVTSRRTAELIKYAANAFLATKITFINEIADLCEKVGANVQEVARGIGLDNRIGSKFLHAGPGYGGSCFPKDTLALVKTAQGKCRRHAHRRDGGRGQRGRASAPWRKGRSPLAGGKFAARRSRCSASPSSPTPTTCARRPRSPSSPALQDAGALIRAYDPEGMEQARAVLREVDYCPDAYSCVEGADALVIVTEWDEFRALDLDRVKGLMREPLIVDLRNIYRPDEMRRRGFRYVSVGRPS